MRSDLAPARYSRESIVSLLVKLCTARTKELFQSMPYVAAITDTWSRQSRVTVVNLRGINDK